MSLQTLQGGTFSTQDLVAEILRLLPEVLDSVADKEAGRLELHRNKEWLLKAIPEYIRISTNPRPEWQIPDDTVKESER